MSDIDLALKAEGPFFDLVIENGDFKGVESFDTAITVTVFEEKRADETEQPVNEFRRGWWGNALSDVEGYEIGSDLWQFYQARATQERANSLGAKMLEAFDYFVVDGLLTNVLVDSTLIEDNIEFIVSLVRSNNNVESRSFKLWDNTGIEL